MIILPPNHFNFIKVYNAFDKSEAVLDIKLCNILLCGGGEW